jgi:hypothetical protein
MRVLVMASILGLAGCATPCPPEENAAPVAVAFACEDGSTLNVTFTPEVARVAQEGYITLSLPKRGAGPGYRFAEGGAEIRGRGAEVSWSRPGAAETLCREQR